MNCPKQETWSDILHAVEQCKWCSDRGPEAYHNGAPCPRVKSIEYQPNGAIQRVEFREGYGG